MKRLIAGLLILLQFIFIYPVQSHALDDTTTVIIHYVEAEDNTKDWNLWLWPSDAEGSVYYFTEEDNFGKVATIQLDGKHDRVGFIVRTDGWEKDTPNDRFIEEFNNGVGEIWLYGGQEEIFYENPLGSDSIEDESVELSLAYHNYSETYDDVTYKVYVDNDLVEGAFTQTDDYGIYDRLLIENTKGQEAIHVDIVDHGKVTTFDVKKIKDGKANVFLVENNLRVFYAKEDAVYQPQLLEAKLNSTQRIDILTNMPFKVSLDTLDVKVNNQSVEVQALDFDQENGFLSESGFITLANAVAYTDTLEITIPKFDPSPVTLGDIYDTSEFNLSYNYTGNDLGPSYSKEKTSFKVWAPTAKKIELALFDTLDSQAELIEMTKENHGVWHAEVQGDLHNQLYAYRTTFQESEFVVDPYAKAVSVNGLRSAVVDLSRTNPTNWDLDYTTNFTNPTDAIMYEVHIRDLSMHSDSGIENKGLFLGLTERNTHNSNGFSTGLDYIKDLGITHIQLMPIYDYGSIDESINDFSFNWGYDPVNYNALEGSYSSDPYTPHIRIMEFKQAVQAIHEVDLKVTMDVVYNHVYSLNEMAFEKLVPGYYFRKEDNGNYANGSGCGNETASDRPMVRKFIVDSVSYLAREYKLDGFRFDLMGLHDVQTMNAIREALNDIDPSITIIGEGWNMGNVLDESQKANQNQAHIMPGIAHFNDTIRDGLKGSVFDPLDQGFVNGKDGMSSLVFSGIVAGIEYNDISTWGNIEPSQSVTYVEAHDNNTLLDKLKLSNPDDDPETIKKMHLLADSIILTSQGVTFIHAGQEFLRTKFGDHNSYQSSDIINRLDWKQREKNDDVVNYFRNLIEIRKSHPAFTLETKELIREHLIALQVSDNVIAYELKDVTGDTWDDIVVIHNANREDIRFDLPKSGTWRIVSSQGEANIKGLKTIYGGSVKVSDLNSMVLVYQGPNYMIYLLGLILVIIIGGGLYYKRKKSIQ